MNATQARIFRNAFIQLHSEIVRWVALAKESQGTVREARLRRARASAAEYRRFYRIAKDLEKK